MARPGSLKTSLLAALACVVIASGMAISQIAAHRYGDSLGNEAIARAEKIAHNLSLDAVDKILINDLVALHKLLEDQLVSDPAVSYLVIVREGHVIAHTFPKGVPVELIQANSSMNPDKNQMKKIISENGDRYLDIAWPIFSGQAGILRLGYSEKPIRAQIRDLWLQMSLVTLFIMLLAVLLGKYLINRMTRPLLALTHAAERIDEGHLDMQLNTHGHREVEKLAASFNGMLSRIREYMDRLTGINRMLEEKNQELDRSHRQLTTSCTISGQIAALPDLKGITSYLIRSMNPISECRRMVFMLLGRNRRQLFMAGDWGVITADKEGVEKYISWVEDKSTGIMEREVPLFISEFLPRPLSDAHKTALFPIRYNEQPLGVMLVACSEGCRCVKKELDIIQMILDQASGALFRGVLQEEETYDLRSRMEETSEFSGIIGKNAKMQNIYKLIENVAPTDATVLIEGESGTGKELAARAIHQLSHRAGKPFVVINCSAYPSTLIESELFGHEKGAFSGAVKRKLGRFELGNGGTVFLDEIGEIPPSVQIKLLRVIQTHTFERIGGEETIHVDLRILAATNKNLQQEVQKGEFREDLFYRINVIPILMPPLRERRNDIPLLIHHFLKRFNSEQEKEIKGFDPEAMRVLLNYDWPGNVRELENCIEHAAILSKGSTISFSDLPAGMTFGRDEKFPGFKKRSISEQEVTLIREILVESNWNKKIAADRLGISRSTLYEKMKRFRIEKPAIH
ncbi:MAG: sigma 54-interacting transcriptional regulator [Thermodesulfobacteriota bacterium]